MKPLSVGRDSYAWLEPPRGELPVVREQPSEGRGEEAEGNAAFEHTQVTPRGVSYSVTSLPDRPWIELFARLPPPFQRVLEVRDEASGFSVFLARFIGVGGLDLLKALEGTGRVLPVDVALALAQIWAEALVQVPPGNEGWRTPVALGQLGVDVRGELVLTFDEPNHAIGRWWMHPNSSTQAGGYRQLPESISPEMVRGLPIGETARVYSLAVSLLALLEGRRLFDKHDSMLSMISDIALKGLDWGTPRNPACSPELAQVLRQATALDPAGRFQTLPELLSALRSAAQTAPATQRRMMDVLLGISPRMLSCLEKLEPEALPTTWREGGLQVLNDRLLERLVPITALPEART